MQVRMYSLYEASDGGTQPDAVPYRVTGLNFHYVPVVMNFRNLLHVE
jgi:hypothetical protein